MKHWLLIGLTWLCGHNILLAQQPPSLEQQDRVASPGKGSAAQGEPVTGSDVAVNPAAQSYRPVPANALKPRQTIFEFYFAALNPRKTNWGDEIDRRLAILSAQSIGNPFFRLCAMQTGAILFLLLLCWVWWDKMRQIKWVAAECLTDVINAKRFADRRAIEAIDAHNRHMDLCNRVIEQQQSGILAGNNSTDSQLQIQELQMQLVNERAAKARLEEDVKHRDELYAQMEARVAQMEERLRVRNEDVNAKLVARLSRAEAELSGPKGRK